MLNAIDRIVASGFKRTYRIVAVPLQQLVDGPIGQSQIGAGSEHNVAGTTGIVTHARHVACREIEINAREVTFVFVSNLKHSAVISAKGTRAQFPCSIYSACITISKWIITTFAVHKSVNGK